MDDEARTTVSSMLQTADSSTDVPETSGASTVGGSPQPQQPAQELPTESTQASAIYQKYMPKILDHSANQRFTDLIDDAMKADLAVLITLLSILGDLQSPNTVRWRPHTK